MRVFVFRLLQGGIEYLLLRPRPTHEWPFGPVVGTVRPDEHFRDTVIRKVAAETGLLRPTWLAELAQPGSEIFGDVGIVEWPFAFQAGTASAPPAPVRPSPRIADYAWLSFEQAFTRIDDRDREALVRLHLDLG